MVIHPGTLNTAASSGADAPELQDHPLFAQPWFRATKVLRALEDGPHAACKLMVPTGMDRSGVTSGIGYLKRRGLVEHVGAWRLTELGKIALNANKRFLQDVADGPQAQDPADDDTTRSEGTPSPSSPPQPQPRRRCDARRSRRH